ncbi:MAG: DegT/DnrJ/EryC1/StrS family aminotransferase, partial [Acidobacteriota bacterium]|nr:DegT/DnrJ/EryC1/StrS family aminotransferase [Acidobacteriota bacterium]
LGVKLKHLDRWNDLRRAHARRYTTLLGDAARRGRLVLPSEMPYARHVYHLYVVQTDRRDELQKRLSEAGVQTGIHYPVPVHLQPAYSLLGYTRGDFPEAERQAARVLSLPMYPELTDEQIEHVAAVVSGQWPVVRDSR